MPVVNETGKLVGIIAEKDVIQAMYPSYDELIQDPVASRDFEGMEERYQDLGRIPADRIMTNRVITVPPECPCCKPVRS